MSFSFLLWRWMWVLTEWDRLCQWASCLMRRDLPLTKWKTSPLHASRYDKSTQGCERVCQLPSSQGGSMGVAQKGARVWNYSEQCGWCKCDWWIGAGYLIIIILVLYQVFWERVCASSEKQAIVHMGLPPAGTHSGVAGGRGARGPLDCYHGKLVQ